MDLAIKLENVYKEYRLGVIGHGTLYKDLQSFFAKIRGLEDPNSLIGSSKEIVDRCLQLMNGVNDLMCKMKYEEVENNYVKH